MKIYYRFSALKFGGAATLNIFIVSEEVLKASMRI